MSGSLLGLDKVQCFFDGFYGMYEGDVLFTDHSCFQHGLSCEFSKLSPEVPTHAYDGETV